MRWPTPTHQPSKPCALTNGTIEIAGTCQLKSHASSRRCAQVPEKVAPVKLTSTAPLGEAAKEVRQLLRHDLVVPPPRGLGRRLGLDDPAALELCRQIQRGGSGV